MRRKYRVLLIVIIIILALILLKYYSSNKPIQVIENKHIEPREKEKEDFEIELLNKTQAQNLADKFRCESILSADSMQSFYFLYLKNNSNKNAWVYLMFEKLLKPDYIYHRHKTGWSHPISDYFGKIKYKKCSIPQLSEGIFMLPMREDENIFDSFEIAIPIYLENLDTPITIRKKFRSPYH
jgi:hypothetical protein